jgi:hypothetical protein
MTRQSHAIGTTTYKTWSTAEHPEKVRISPARHEDCPEMGFLGYSCILNCSCLHGPETLQVCLTLQQGHQVNSHTGTENIAEMAINSENY